MIPEWIDKNNYTCVPFYNLGTTPRGWDCYGLVKYISEKHFNKVLPEVRSYVNANDPKEVINTIREQVKCWEKVEVPQPGDVILFRFQSVPVHCGLVLDDTWMIHVMKDCMTALEKYKQFPWNQRYDAAYTYKN